MNAYVFAVIMSLFDSLSVCLSVITWQKIDQAGGPETFNFVWLKKFKSKLLLQHFKLVFFSTLYVTCMTHPLLKLRVKQILLLVMCNE